MSYYETVTKPKRQQAQLLACARGAPDGARTVDGFAYWVMPLTVNAAALHIRKWTHQGKCKRKVYGISQHKQFPIEGYDFHWPSLTMYKIGTDLPSQEHWQLLRARALTPFMGEDVQIPATLLVGDTVEASRRSYHKRQAAKLMRLMPAGYTLLPGNRHIAYRLEPQGEQLLLRTAKPRAKEDELKHEAFLMLGEAMFEGQRYQLSPCGTKLYRAGRPEDLFGAQDDVIEQMLVFEELRPKDKPVLAPHPVWYEVELGAAPKVAFHCYQGRNEKVQRSLIVEGKVSYRDNTYKVTPHGTLKPL